MEKLIDNIYRICVPFDNIYTSVFVVKCEDKYVLLDSATTDFDVEEYIYPKLKEAGIKPDLIIISHLHSDHSGGVEKLKEYFPGVKIAMFGDKLFKDRQLKDSEVIYGVLKILNLKGHSNDSLAVLDLRTDTVLTFDCVQLLGIGRYRNGIADKKEYLNSLNRLKALNAENLIASHDYDPLGFSAWGKDKVLEYLDYAMNV